MNTKQSLFNDIKRNYVYIFPSVHNTTCVVNYDWNNSQVNNFLSLFDIWGSHGQRKAHFQESNYESQVDYEVWFECSKEFTDLATTPDMVRAFKRMNVNVVTDYPFSFNLEQNRETLEYENSIGKTITVSLGNEEITGKLLGILRKNVEYTYSMFEQEIIQKFPEYFPQYQASKSDKQDYWKFRNERISIISAIHAKHYNRVVLGMPGGNISIVELKEGSTCIE